MNNKIISLLYIEDVSSEQNSIIQALAKNGVISDFAIKTASSLNEGLKILEDNPIDVVLLDLDLPDSKDLKSVSRLLHEHPDIAIVVLSGHSEEGIVTEALMMGAQEFLIKGECSGATIRHTIKQALIRNRIHKEEKEGVMEEM